MNVYILTLFPEVFESVFSKSIVKRTQNKKILHINYINIRDFGLGKHKQVDDKPYGGGSGMVMMVEPVLKALSTIKPKPYTVLLSASGSKFTQQKAGNLANKKNLALICGHYEGTDARIENSVDETISIGDYVLTGGEIPAMILVDSISRLLPGAINANSPLEESFNGDLVEHPQYTRPEVYKGLKVPPELLSGDHQKIKTWREKQSKLRTKKFRPDLLSSRKD